MEVNAIFASAGIVGEAEVDIVIPAKLPKRSEGDASRDPVNVEILHTPSN